MVTFDIRIFGRFLNKYILLRPCCLKMTDKSDKHRECSALLPVRATKILQNGYCNKVWTFVFTKNAQNFSKRVISQIIVQTNISLNI